MNERDSEIIAALLQQCGYTITRHENNADVIIVNTCSVREKAEDKAVGKLRLLTARRKKEPGRPIIGAVGCMVQRMQSDIFRKVPGLDFALGTARLAGIAGAVANAVAGKRGFMDASGEDPGRGGDAHIGGKISAFINVLQGCNRHCSYCIVPEVRGNEWSRPAQEIIAEAAALVKGGTKEITLLGQSILSYGRADRVWDEGYTSRKGFAGPFPRLLEALNSIEGLKRLRFTSSHPSGCTDELARALSELPAVCPHVHLPVQSGSDRILELMNRGYTIAEYRAAVERLKALVPHIAVTTDIIVGFPTETKEEFGLTGRLMDEIGFDNSFIFKYSPRPGTKAFSLEDDVSAAEKLRRNHVLLEAQNRRSLVLNQRWVGKECSVLVEGPSRRNANRLTARTATNLIAVFDAFAGARPGDMATIKIIRAEAQTLYGVMR